MESTFARVAILILLSAGAGAVAVRLRQPLVIAFIATGILAGPAGLGWVTVADPIDLLAQMGIALLLFIVGLKLDLHIVQTMGFSVLAIGLAQVALVGAAGYGAAVGLGLPVNDAVYVGLGLALSSTVIVVKLLSDKREIEALHGRAAVGVLIVQDIIVILAMITATALGARGQDLGTRMGEVLTNGALFLGGLALVARFVLPGLLRGLARSQELLVLFAIAWALGLAAGSHLLGLSKEIGAFAAGVTLASTQYREAIGPRLVGLRDFLLLFFFIDLGAHVRLESIESQIVPALLLSAIVLFGKPLVFLALMGLAGYRRRTGFLTGTTMAQISEFSLILAALGAGLGQIGEDTVALITLVGLVTITASTYLISYGDALCARFSPWLGLFERRSPIHEEEPSDLGTFDAVVFGLGSFGRTLVESLHAQGWRVMGVDYDPEVVRSWRGAAPVRYGDAEDGEYLKVLPIPGTRWVISAVPDRGANLALLAALRMQGYDGRIALRARAARDVETLERMGADMVLSPLEVAAADAVGRLT